MAIEVGKTLGSPEYSQVEDTDPDDSTNTGCKGTTDGSSDRIPSHLLVAWTKKSARPSLALAYHMYQDRDAATARARKNPGLTFDQVTISNVTVNGKRFTTFTAFCKKPRNRCTERNKRRSRIVAALE